MSKDEARAAVGRVMNFLAGCNDGDIRSGIGAFDFDPDKEREFRDQLFNAILGDN